MVCTGGALGHDTPADSVFYNYLLLRIRVSVLATSRWQVVVRNDRSGDEGSRESMEEAVSAVGPYAAQPLKALFHIA